LNHCHNQIFSLGHKLDNFRPIDNYYYYYCHYSADILTTIWILVQKRWKFDMIRFNILVDKNVGLILFICNNVLTGRNVNGLPLYWDPLLRGYYKWFYYQLLKFSTSFMFKYLNHNQISWYQFRKFHKVINEDKKDLKTNLKNNFLKCFTKQKLN